MDANQKIFNQIKEELKIDLTDKEYDYVLNQFNSFSNNLEFLANLDLNKYQKYNYHQLEFHTLRDDNVIEIVKDNKKYFKNAVDFNGEYVVIKNEK